MSAGEVLPMARWFNVAGPCNPADHYMLPALARLPDVARLIAQKSYFVLHAPRQTGKTTAMLALARELTASGQYVAALLSAEVGAPFSDDPGAAEAAILDEWRLAAHWQLPVDLTPAPWPAADPGARIATALSRWAAAAPRPLVVFLDEIDALQNAALLSVLRQIRDGFPGRPTAFPVVLPIEVKVWRDGESDPRTDGLAQLDAYLTRLGAATGWLVIFDQRAGRPPIAERTTTEAATAPSGRSVTVIRA